MRALEQGAFYDYTAMTLEECLSDCNGYQWWGVEYGGECWSNLFFTILSAFHLARPSSDIYI
jgi:hypothetical protein